MTPQEPDDAALRAAFRKGFQEGLAIAERTLAGQTGAVLALPKQRHEHPQTWCGACVNCGEAMGALGKGLIRWSGKHYEIPPP